MSVFLIYITGHSKWSFPGFYFQTQLGWIFNMYSQNETGKQSITKRDLAFTKCSNMLKATLLAIQDNSILYVPLSLVLCPLSLIL